MVVLASRSRGNSCNGQHQFKPSVSAAISSPAASDCFNSLQETADSETEVSRNYIPKRIYINIDRAYPYQY